MNKGEHIDPNTGEVIKTGRTGMPTDVQAFISEIDGGVFEEKLSAALSEVAAAVVDYDGKGRVQITFDFERLGNSHQVSVKHKLIYKRPTPHGSASEDNSTSTPMHVGKRGKLSIFPEDQHQMFGKKGEILEKGNA